MNPIVARSVGFTIYRRMAILQEPIGMSRIELQELMEQHRGHIGHAHRHARVAGIGLLHRVHGKRPYGIGHLVMGHHRLRRGRQKWLFLSCFEYHTIALSCT